jgi:hypothetical protein
MYATTRNMAGDTFMTCNDCGHAISMNKLCEKPIQSATDMLKHMAAHSSASRAFAAVGRVIRPKPEGVSVIELASTLPASQQQGTDLGFRLPN